MKRIIITIFIILSMITNSFAQFIGMGMRMSYNHPFNLSTLSQLQSFGGLTFYKNYVKNQTNANADYSIGSPTATVTAARSAGAPATYFDSSGLIHTLTTANVPRWTQGFYDSTGFHSSPGILVESGGAQTEGRNVAQYSTAFTNAVWTATNVTAVDSVSDGVLSATVSTLTASAGNGNITQAFTDGSAGIYTASIFIKRETGTGTINLRANTGNSYTAVTVTSSWTRVQVSSTSLTNPTFDLQIVTNGDAIYVYGAQLEKFPTMTSYIPTTGASATRASELLSYPISGNRTASQESIFIKFIPLGNNFVNDSQQRTLTDTDTKERLICKTNTGTTVRTLPNNTDSSTVAAVGTSSQTEGSSFLFTGTMQGTNPKYVRSYGNGVNEAEYTSATYTVPSWGTNFYIGCRSLASSGQINGIVQSVAIYSTWQDDPSVNHIAYILSPDTVTYHSYTFTPSVYSISNVISGSTTGTTITNSDYEYISVDIQTGTDTILHFARAGLDDGTADDGYVVMRAYTISTSSWGSRSTIYTPGAGICAASVAGFVSGTQIFLYVTQYTSGNQTSNNKVYLIKSTDLTGTSWGSPTLVYTADPSGFTQATRIIQGIANPNNVYMLLAGYESGKHLHIIKSTDGGNTFPTDNVIYGGAANYSEADIINVDDTNFIIVHRNDAGDYLRIITSTNGMASWSASALTTLGQSTGQKVEPRMKLAAGNPNRLIISFYDRGNSRMTITGPTKISDALLNQNWAAIYLLGNSARGYGDLEVLQTSLYNYTYLATVYHDPTGSGTEADLIWWKFQDIYTWTHS
jgi:hypothetical protein